MKLYLIKAYIYMHYLILRVTNWIWILTVIFPYIIYIGLTSWRRYVDADGQFNFTGLWIETINRSNKIMVLKDKILPVVLGIVIIYFIYKTI